jgi:RNA polymerase sigma factor (sigma-70 family)
VNEDLELVERAKAGDSAAFSMLYERYFDRVYDFLARMVRDEAEAADLAQDTFLKAMSSLATLSKGATFKSWLFTIARHTALNRLERASRSQPLEGQNDAGEEQRYDVIDPDRFANPEEAAEAEGMAAIVWEAARGLDERSYSVLHLTVREGLESAEIADVLGVTKNNAYVMVNRMKKSLEDAIGALVLLRNGRRHCNELDTELARLQITDMTPEVRRVIERHAGACENCRDRRNRMASPFAIFAGMAVLQPSTGVREGILQTLQQSFSQVHGSSGGQGSGGNDGGAGDHAQSQDADSPGADDGSASQISAAGGIAAVAGDSPPPRGTPISAIGEPEEEHRKRRVIAALALAALLFIGAAITAIAFFAEDDQPAEGETAVLAPTASPVPQATATATLEPSATTVPADPPTEPPSTPTNIDPGFNPPIAPSGSSATSTPLPGPTQAPGFAIPTSPPGGNPGGGGSNLVATAVPPATPTPIPPSPTPTVCVPTVAAAPASLVFDQGESTKTFRLAVDGCGGSVAYSLTPGASWVHVSPASGSIPAGGSQQIVVTVSPGDNAAHTSRIQVSAAGKTFNLSITIEGASRPPVGGGGGFTN